MWRAEGIRHSCVLRVGNHGGDDVYEVVEAKQVAVLAVPLRPGGPMDQLLALCQGCRLPKVNHPHLGLLTMVMDEQQRAANHLGGERKRGQRQRQKRGEEMRGAVRKRRGVSVSAFTSNEACEGLICSIVCLHQGTHTPDTLLSDHIASRGLTSFPV